MRLRCTPEIESAILLPIYQAMEQVYEGDARGNPFAWLSEIGCPVRIATAGVGGGWALPTGKWRSAFLPATPSCSHH